MAADLEFRISASIAELKKTLGDGLAEIGAFGRKAQDEIDKSVRPRDARGRFLPRGAQNEINGVRGALVGVETGVGAVTRALGPMIAGFASVAGVIRAIAAADEFNTLNARLRIATRSAEEFTRAQSALFDLAQRSRASLTETIDLYSRISLATKDAAVGQETLLQVVETINQAVALSGASTQAAQAALVQLGQGLASGTLRGEELNSILEQTPVLADAIANGLGITRGELRQYGQEGRLSAEQVIRALLQQQAVINAQFSQLPVTVGQAVTQVRNASLQLLGAFDQASGSTSGLARVIQDLARFLSSDQVLGAVVEFGVIVQQYFELARDVVTGAIQAIVFAFDVLGTALNATIGQFNQFINEFTGGVLDLPVTAGQGVDLIVRAFRELPANIRASLQIVTVQAAAVFDRIISYATFVKDNLRAIFTDDTFDASFARFQARNAAITQALGDSVDFALAEREKALADAKKAREEAEARRQQGRQNTGANSLGNFRAPTDQQAAQRAAQLRRAELDAQEKLLDDAAQRQLAILEEQFEDSQIAAATYYRRREQIEIESLNRSIAIERERAAAGGVEAVKALAQVELLERQKADIVRNGARQRAEFERNLERQLEQARIQQLQASGQDVEAARARAEATYRDLLARLTAEGNTAGIELVRRLINTEEADARIEQLRNSIGTALGDLRGTEALIAAQVDAGQLPALEGERQLQVVREEGIAQLTRYRDALQAIADAQIAAGGVADPRVVESIRQTNTEIARATASQRTLQNTINQSAQNSLQGFFSDLASGATSFGDAVRRAALSFVQSLAQMAAEALAKRAILSLGGGAGGIGGLIAGFFHSGGIVGAGGTMRAVNPLAFAGAPRYDSGGMVGLKPDERPAILQTGEEVLSRGDPRNAANGGGAGAGVRILNVIDPAIVSDYLSSSAGEKTVLNVLQRNPGAVRQVLA